MKRFKRKKILYILLILLVILIIVLLLISSHSPGKKLKIMDVSFDDRTEELSKVSFDEAIPVGWVQVQGTNIDLPVLIVGINADIPVTENYSWQSINYNQGENREVIIIHNLLNLSSNPSTNMKELNFFEGLMAFVYHDFAEENLYIEYLKDGKREVYAIYAAGFYDNEYDLGQSYSSPKNINNYIEMVRNNSIYDYDIEVDSSDKLITLKTCTRFFGNSEKQQFQIDARKLSDDEKTYYYSVEKNSLYYELLEESGQITVS